MAQSDEAPLALTIVGLLYLGLGVWSAVTPGNVLFTIGILGLGVIQTIYFGRRYLQQRRKRTSSRSVH